jgi:hypothetical protein
VPGCGTVPTERSNGAVASDCASANVDAPGLPQTTWKLQISSVFGATMRRNGFGSPTGGGVEPSRSVGTRRSFTLEDYPSLGPSTMSFSTEYQRPEMPSGRAGSSGSRRMKVLIKDCFTAKTASESR